MTKIYANDKNAKIGIQKLMSLQYNTDNEPKETAEKLHISNKCVCIQRGEGVCSPP